jgi:hypothetical protein
MSHEYHVQTLAFTGVSAHTMDDARALADRELAAWYDKQELLFSVDGSSLFHFSTAAYVHNEMFYFVITVFDTRRTKA